MVLKTGVITAKIANKPIQNYVIGTIGDQTLAPLALQTETQASIHRIYGRLCIQI